LCKERLEEGEDYLNVLTSDQARGLADTYRELVLRHYGKLCGLLEGRKDAILKRWKSYDTKRRTSAIREVCPELDSSHLINEIFRQLEKFKCNDAYRMDFLLFPISTELLANNPLGLIALADRRSSLKPEAYAAHDMEQVVLGLRQGSDICA
jgi:hypothetical protein